MSKVNLSERVRPNCEAAPWVIEEIRKLEAELEHLQGTVEQRLAGLERKVTALPAWAFNPTAEGAP